jgi:hypothetical protein
MDARFPALGQLASVVEYDSSSLPGVSSSDIAQVTTTTGPARNKLTLRFVQVLSFIKDR